MAKRMGIRHNVTIRVLDEKTHEVVSEHVGHNQATDSLLTGIAHYLKGDGILNQGIDMLGHFIPKYISLGTMGLNHQGMDELGLPTGIGNTPQDFEYYMSHTPGYGADGYDLNDNNSRGLPGGLGPMYNGSNLNCELISPSFPRAMISYREIIPENKSEREHSIDVVFSAMISTGALKQFRDKVSGSSSSGSSDDSSNTTCDCGCPGCAGCTGNNSGGSSGDSNGTTNKEKDVGYIFITEAGLWSRPDWSDSSSNGLLAGYRIIPPDEKNWAMVADPENGVTEEQAAKNREILRRNIICVRTNQVVQVIWKIQLISVGDTERRGKCNCDCTCTDKSHPSPTCPCHGDKNPTTVVLDKHNAELRIDDRLQLTATVTPDTVGVVWTSTDSRIVTVSNTGEVTAISSGSAVIKATANDNSGAFDSCRVVVNHSLPIDDEVEKYSVFTTGNLVLGANVRLTTENMCIGNSIGWESSGTPGGLITGSVDANLYVVGNNTSTYENAAIVSHGGNIFDTNVYLGAGAETYLVNCTSEYTFPRGIKVLHNDFELPTINELSYNVGTNTISPQQGDSVLIYPNEAIILTPNAIYGQELKNYQLNDGTIVSGYVSGRIPSSSKDYGAYHDLNIQSNSMSQTHVYIGHGTYAFNSIGEAGNYNHIHFVDARPSDPIILYVKESISLSNDNFIHNDGDLKSAMLYCAGDIRSEFAHNMRFYMVAPKGTISISGSREDAVIEGSLYAKNIYIGNNTVLDIV